MNSSPETISIQPYIALDLHKHSIMVAGQNHRLQNADLPHSHLLMIPVLKIKRWELASDSLSFSTAPFSCFILLALDNCIYQWAAIELTINTVHRLLKASNARSVKFQMQKILMLFSGCSRWALHHTTSQDGIRLWIGRIEAIYFWHK